MVKNLNSIMKQINEVTLTGESLTVEQVKAVARDYALVKIGKDAASNCKRGYDILQKKNK
jgi:histidine ammonia-lyase